jgi:hypothetical protein
LCLHHRKIIVSPFSLLSYFHRQNVPTYEAAPPAHEPDFFFKEERIMSWHFDRTKLSQHTLETHS